MSISGWLGIGIEQIKKASLESETIVGSKTRVYYYQKRKTKNAKQTKKPKRSNRVVKGEY